MNYFINSTHIITINTRNTKISIITTNTYNRYILIITTFIYLSINIYLRIIYGNTMPTTIILH